LGFPTPLWFGFWLPDSGFCILSRMPRPTRDELEARVRDGTYEKHARAAMKDFCFTVTKHEGKQRTWFGEYTVTLNRNVAFNFFPRDMRDDPDAEPYAVVRGERTETLEMRVRSQDAPVPVFMLSPDDYGTAVDSIERIKEEIGDLRLLPDAYFADTDIVRLLVRLAGHPSVRAERGADWPPLLQ